MYRETRAKEETVRYGKYGNKRPVIDVDGQKAQFDSKREAQRFVELRLLERGGIVRNIRRQVPYELVPVQRDADGKVIERSVKYIADFVYEKMETGGTWREVVEDAKGYHTKEYVLKRKLMLYLKGIRIEEV